MSELLPQILRETPDFSEGYGVFGMHYHIGQGSRHILLNVLADQQTASMEASVLGAELNVRYDDTAGDEPTPYHELAIMHWDFPQLELVDCLPIREKGVKKLALPLLSICDWEPECSIDSYFTKLAMDAKYIGLWYEASSSES